MAIFDLHTAQFYFIAQRGNVIRRVKVPLTSLTDDDNKLKNYDKVKNVCTGLFLRAGDYHTQTPADSGEVHNVTFQR